jgi:outer membrane immunogenic protein
MKRILLAATMLATAALLQPATAADLGRPVTKAPPLVAPPPFTWSGVYIGAHLGWTWGEKDWNQTFSSFGFPLDVASADVDGFLGGFQIGVNYQIGAWVLGLESDWAWTDADGCGNQVLFPAFAGCSKVNWIYTLTGRLGFTGWWNGRALLYIKGGFAAADDKHFITFLGTQITDTVGGTRNGWTIGGGLEWAFADNWSAKIEYNYLNFEDKGHDFIHGPLSLNPGLFERWDISQQMHVVKFGLNYRFWTAAAPVVARN